MKIFQLQSTNPYLNLATEEYLFRNFDDDFFLLWQNAHTIVVGKHQQTLAEINLPLTKELGIRVVRRMTGGGAVYHDMGNLNFSFIRRVEQKLKALDIFKEFTLPIVDALRALGLPAEVDGRNDILIEGKKISGNALFVQGSRILEHGTLLVNVDLSVLTKVLTPKQQKFEGKAIQSVASRVANLHDWLSEPLSIPNLSSHILKHVHLAFRGAEDFELSPQDWTEIQKIAHEKYETDDWNFGKSPVCSFERSIRTGAGTITAHLKIEGNKLEHVQFSGDFFSMLPIEEFQDKLQGCPLNDGELEIRVAEAHPEHYFSGINVDEFLDLLR